MLLEKVDKSEIKEYPNDVKCKLGFLDSILRKWFGNPFSDDGKQTQQFSVIMLTLTFIFTDAYLDLTIVHSLRLLVLSRDMIFSLSFSCRNPPTIQL